MERSEEQGIPAARVYGMTELPTVTVMNRAYPFDLRAETDGAIAPGVEVRVVDGPIASTCQPDAEGELLGARTRADARATSTRRPTGRRPRRRGVVLAPVMSVSSTAPASSPSPGGSRTSINRGGEKFSARDIEDLLITHPAVRQAAVVPGPDARFGEVPVAFVVFDGLAAGVGRRLARHLHAIGLARQKTPVAWHFVDALPMTPSGKVKKFELMAHQEPLTVTGRNQ